MAPAKARKLYRVKSPFITAEDGREVPYLVNGDVYWEDHHAVKKHLGAFEEVTPHGPAARGVETTTANPGESR